MDRLFLFLVLSLFAVTGPADRAQAQDDTRMPAASTPARSAHGMHGMQQMHGRGSMQDVQDDLEQMQALMTQARNTDDAAERQRLMQQHMQMMHDTMKRMGQMMSQPATDEETSPAGDAMHRRCKQSDMACRMEGMQGRQRTMADQMGMMQMMMDQMMEHMEACPHGAQRGQR